MLTATCPCVILELNNIGTCVAKEKYVVLAKLEIFPFSWKTDNLRKGQFSNKEKHQMSYLTIFWIKVCNNY